MADGSSTFTDLTKEYDSSKEMVACPEIMFRLHLQEIRNVDAALSIIAEIAQDLIPVEEANGDINDLGRKVHWLMISLQEQSQKLYESYSWLMECAGMKPDNSGLYQG